MVGCGTCRFPPTHMQSKSAKVAGCARGKRCSRLRQTVRDIMEPYTNHCGRSFFAGLHNEMSSVAGISCSSPKNNLGGSVNSSAREPSLTVSSDAPVTTAPNSQLVSTVTVCARVSSSITRTCSLPSTCSINRLGHNRRGREAKFLQFPGFCAGGSTSLPCLTPRPVSRLVVGLLRTLSRLRLLV